MKLHMILAVTAAATLSGCGDPGKMAVREGPQNQTIGSGQTVTTAAPPQSTALNVGVAAFRDICVATAPSFAGATAAASAYGITTFTELGDLRLGMRPDNAIGAQITAGTACTITTASQAQNPLAQFVRVVPGLSNATLPSVINIGGTSFIIQHDRQGGEAFVMLKR